MILPSAFGALNGSDFDFAVRWLADRERTLEQLAPPDPHFHTQLWVLSHRDLRNVARIKALSQFLYDALRQDAHVFPA